MTRTTPKEKTEEAQIGRPPSNSVSGLVRVRLNTTVDSSTMSQINEWVAAARFNKNAGRQLDQLIEFAKKKGYFPL